MANTGEIKMKNAKKVVLTRMIFSALGVVLLIMGSIIAFVTCSSGVNVGEAKKVLTSFSLKWPAGFDYTCASNEPVTVVFSAHDQDGEVFNWLMQEMG